MSAAARRARGLTGRHVVLVLAGFFVTVLAVDGFMVASALDTQPGLVADHPYERGLAHNALLADEARQAALHWRITLGHAADRVVLALADGRGAPLAADQVALRLIRPSDAALDRALVPRALGDGQWQADIHGVPAGLWQVAVTVIRGRDRFDRVERLVLP